MDEYGKLNTASLGTEYLLTNATTHSFIFGAMAELVDNARDAGSHSLSIYTEDAPHSDRCSSSPLLWFQDDGCGMSQAEAENVIVFGSSKKTNEEENVGMYGNGLKSGSMRLGKDMMVFTKKDEVLTCLMISRTFFKEENVTQIKVPVPAFDYNSRKPVCTDKKKHELEVRLITTYSPFKTLEELFEQFDRITASTGTIVLVYNLSTTPSGELELDFETDPEDIRAATQPDPDNMTEETNDVVEMRSFRSYTSILYKSPRMKIVLCGKKVRTRLLAYSLYLPKRISVSYKNFKNLSDKQVGEMKQLIEVLKHKLVEVQSDISKLNKSSTNTNKAQMTKIRQLQAKEAQISEDITSKKAIMAHRQKQSKKSEELEFFFGVNLNERYHDGLFFYIGDRLIKMYVKEGTLQSKEEITYRGIIGVISVPKSSLLPTHNKQDFNDLAEYKKLRKCVDQAMTQYNRDFNMSLEKNNSNPAQFWSEVGYTERWRAPPSEDEKFKQRRARLTRHLQQCDKCLKWREIAYSKEWLYKEFPENWCCSDSMDPKTNQCKKPEALPKIECTPLRKGELPATTKKPEPVKRKLPTVQEQIREEEAKKAKRIAHERKTSPEPRARLKSKPTAKSFTQSPSLETSRKPSSTASRPGPASSKAQPTRCSASSRVRQPSTSSEEEESHFTPQVRRILTRNSPKRDIKSSPRTPAQTTTYTKRTFPLAENDEDAPQSPPNITADAVLAPELIKVSSTPPERLPEVERYRDVTTDDTKDKSLHGKTVQGRYKNFWQDAVVMEVNVDTLCLRFSDGMRMLCKVGNKQKSILPEVRVKITPNGTIPDSNGLNAGTVTSTSEIELKQSQQANALLKKLQVAMSLLGDKSSSSMTLDAAEKVDVNTAVKAYTDKLKQDIESKVRKEMSQGETSLKQEVSKLRAEVAKAKDDKNKSVVETEKKWQARETERFERIKSLFSTVLAVCIGNEPEYRFNTYEELITLLASIADSLAHEPSE